MRRRMYTALLATGIAAVAMMPMSASAAPTTADPNAPSTGTVSALSGGAAARAAGQSATTFRALRTQLREHATSGPLAQLHTWWGSFTQQGSGSGEMATQDVSPSLTVSHSGDVVYAPTMKPAGGSCIEVVTAYDTTGGAIWAWDWCGSAGPAKVVQINSDFLAKYTTSVDGDPAYTVREVRTNASSNTWQAALYNQQTKTWDTLFTSSGSDQSGLSEGWDMFEIYASTNPATGNGYYCTDAKGDVFDSSSIKLRTSSGWQAITQQNSTMQPTGDPQPADYRCPSLHFTLPTTNSHWTVAD